MNEDRRSRIEDLFHQARELNASDREGFLRRECAGDAALRDEVESLLASYQEIDEEFLRGPQLREEPAAALPETIGPFKVLNLLGEGGMGSVYLAEQTEPIARKVALKVIKAGMDSQQVLARFETERNVLAILDHPGIAHIYEAGVTVEGRPWFAMEYAPGEPITDYCDGRRLSLRDRIGLFLQVCEAIQHAHHKGVIHRDIKPGNVIVSNGSGAPSVKVIDFGIAKAIEGDLATDTRFTRAGQRLGTPEYMSPEQAALEDVDTRTDVYGLGLLLYELLVGALPFDAATLQQHGFEAMMHVIREVDPPLASQRVNAREDTATTAAEHRDTKPRSLSRFLRGELDWILLRSLEKERDRRYDSAAAFADDLRRYLRHEPITAHPPSASYRALKFARRNRVAVGVAATVFVALGVIAVQGKVQSRRVAEQRDRAEHEAAVSREVASFLGDMYHDAASEHGRAERIDITDVLDLGVTNLEESEQLSTEAQARLFRILGEAYSGLAQSARASGLLEQAVDLARTKYGDDHIETAEARFPMIALMATSGQYAEAADMAKLVHPTFERELGPGDPRTMRCLWYLAAMTSRVGEYETSVAYSERLRDVYLETLGPDNTRLAMVLNDLGATQFGLARYAEARETLQEAARIMEVNYGREDARSAISIMTLANFERNMGRFDVALEQMAEVEAVLEATFGRDHPQMGNLLTSRGWVHLKQKEIQPAREALEAAAKILDRQNLERYAVVAQHGLAVVEREEGAIEASRARLESVLATTVEMFGAENLRVAQCLLEMGKTELAARNVAAADSLTSRALSLAQGLLPATHPELAAVRVAWGECLLAQARFEAAESELLAAHEVLNTAYPADSSLRGLAREALDRLTAARETAGQ